MQDLDGKVIVLTGANSGIGFETARSLARRGASLVLACRNAEKAEAARQELEADTNNPNLSVLPLDLSSPDSIRAFVAAFVAEHDRLDVLVNNAGTFSVQRKETAGGLELTFATNHLGPLLLTLLLLPLLERAEQGRVVNVSSEAALFGKLNPDDLQLRVRYGRYGFDAYAASKRAQVLCTQELAGRLGTSPVTVNAVHPGHVSTNIWPTHRWVWRAVTWIQARFAITAAEAAPRCVHLVCAEELAAVTGQFFKDDEALELPEDLRDPAARRQIWDLSLALLELERSELEAAGLGSPGA